MPQKFISKIILLAICFSLILSPSSVLAAKKRVRIQTPPFKTGTGYSSVKLSRPTNSVILNLFNLNKASKINYALNYTANGVSQGAIGSVLLSSQSQDKRDFYFGTCSKNVCTPHTNIKNATLTVTTLLKTGGKYTKRYRLKI